MGAYGAPCSPSGLWICLGQTFNSMWICIEQKCLGQTFSSMWIYIEQKCLGQTFSSMQICIEQKCLGQTFVWDRHMSLREKFSFKTFLFLHLFGCKQFYLVLHDPRIPKTCLVLKSDHGKWVKKLGIHTYTTGICFATPWVVWKNKCCCRLGQHKSLVNASFERSYSYL